MSSNLTESASPITHKSKELVESLGGAGRWIVQVVPVLALMTGLIALIYGCILILQSPTQSYTVPILGILCVTLQLLFVAAHWQHQRWDRNLALVSLLAFVFLVVLRYLPEYVTGLQINAVIHRSVFEIVFLIGAGLPATCLSIYYWLGATPRAEDLSHYPLLLLPVLIAFGLYIVLITHLVTHGLPNLSLEVLRKPYFDYTWPVRSTIDDGWPTWTSEVRSQVGILNHLLGTGLLMLLTSAISLPIGVGAGVYLSEYADGWLSSMARFSITALRAISLLILGLTAFSLANAGAGTPLAAILRGTFFNGWEVRISAGGSFLTASLILSLLVIPIIALSTEEGCRALPPELREGSVALGATEETTLLRLVLPWSLPNIVTAVVIGCAEVAGSVAVLMFIAGRGDHGVGVFRQVTSLAYLIYDIWYGEKSFKAGMGPYQFTAGVLLLGLTMGLGIVAMLLKRWMVRQFRGG